MVQRRPRRGATIRDVARTISSTIGREGLGRTLSLVLWPAALLFGIAALLVGRPELVALDGLTGFVLVGLGLAAWSLRPRSASGLIMATAGFAWFLGALAPWAVYLHRAPLAHLILTYPTGSLAASSRLFRAAIVAAYAYAAIYPIARNDYATIAFALGLIALATRRYVVAGGPERRARLTALIAATAFGLVLVVGAAIRVAGIETDNALLWAYDAIVCLVAISLFADLLWGRWAQATVTGLVVDLGESDASGTLRDRLARALGDPTLVVGYWLPGQSRYADEAGRPVELPAAEARACADPDRRGRPAGRRRSSTTVRSWTTRRSSPRSRAATRLAVSNARLQAEVRERVAGGRGLAAANRRGRGRSAGSPRARAPHWDGAPPIAGGGARRRDRSGARAAGRGGAGGARRVRAWHSSANACRRRSRCGAP